ncbi:hypothetical protein [Nevskia ramosa]|uniref:hypothetical protein n=1 Tax=Nevskia ramosa TaxID=64002 RepID=UPI002353E209|nr:hypothetical protein [Nevskia ramosa]
MFRITIEDVEHVGRWKPVGDAIQAYEWYFKKQRLEFPRHKGTKLIYKELLLSLKGESQKFRLSVHATEEEMDALKALSQIEFYLFLLCIQLLTDPLKLPILVSP